MIPACAAVAAPSRIASVSEEVTPSVPPTATPVALGELRAEDARITAERVAAQKHVNELLALARQHCYIFFPPYISTC
jgi:hypothetical protein